MNGVTQDGRNLRSQQSRKRIIDAMIELVNEGTLEPTAEQVSARAGLAIRTVFRHFKDMDNLYREIARPMHGKIQAMMADDPASGHWPTDLHKLVDRRIRIYEEMLPMRLAADALRHRSGFLQEEHAAFVTTARRVLRSLLPRAIARDRVRFETLDALLSYELWIRLRRDQKLSVKSAGMVLHQGADAILARAPG